MLKITTLRQPTKLAEEYRDPVLENRKPGQVMKQAVTYTTEHGIEVAVVYLHDLCEIE